MKHKGWVKLAAAWAGLFFLLSCSTAEQAPMGCLAGFLRDKQTTTRQGNLVWLQDYRQALEAAARENKAVLVDFYADWCGWCREMDTKTYSDARVQELAPQFIWLKVNTENDKGTPQRYGVTALPTTILLDSQGREMKRVEGFIPGPAFAQLLNQAMIRPAVYRPECEGTNPKNLVVNGGFQEQFNNWEKSSGDPARGSSKTEVVPLPNSQSGQALYIRHEGEGHIQLSQIVEAPNPDLVFSASIKAVTKEGMIAAFSGSGVVQVGLRYLDEEGNVLGQTVLLNYVKNPFADSGLIGVPRREQDTNKVHYIEFPSGEYGKHQLDLRKEIENNLPGIDAKAIRKIIIGIWCGATHPQAQAEVWVTDVAMSPKAI
jgi:thioredoxin 1